MTTVLYGMEASCDAGCDSRAIDNCITPVITVSDAPYIIRAFGLDDDTVALVEMVAGCGEGEYFAPYTNSCGCQFAITACSPQIVLPVNGRYRLNLCGDPLNPAGPSLPEGLYIEATPLTTGVGVSIGETNMANCGAQVSVTTNPDGSTVIVVDGVATTIPAASSVSMLDAGSSVFLTVNGVTTQIDKGPDTAADIIALLGLRDCAGVPIVAGASLATCADMSASQTAQTTALQAYTDNAVAAATTPASLASTLSFDDCVGNPVPAGAALATCADMNASQAAQTTALQSYADTAANNAAAAATTPAALASALSFDDCAGAPIGAGATLATCADLSAAIAAIPVIPPVSATVTGVVDNTALQELGGADKLINNVQVGHGHSGDIDSTVLGAFTSIGGTAVAVTSIGARAGQSSTASFSTYVGELAGQNNGGEFTTAVGRGAAQDNGGDNLIAFGGSAAKNNAGVDLIAIGSLAGLGNVGAGNVLIGGNAGSANTGSTVIGIGSDAAASNSGSTVFAIGNAAAQTNTGANVIAIGANAAQTNTASDVVAVGGNAAQANTGGLVTAVGRFAASNNTGANVTAVGRTAGRFNTGTNGTFLGFQAGNYARGNFNCFVGASAGVGCFVGENTFVGAMAGLAFGDVGAVAVGYGAASSAAGGGSIFIGRNAGGLFVPGAVLNVTAVDPVTNRFTIPGHGLTGLVPLRINATTYPTPLTANGVYSFAVIDANTLEITVDITTAGSGITLTRNTVNFGANSVAIGDGATTTIANQIMLGNSSTIEVRTAGAYFGTAFNVVSDERNKKLMDFDPKLAAEFSRRVGFTPFMTLSSFAQRDMDMLIAADSRSQAVVAIEADETTTPAEKKKAIAALPDPAAEQRELGERFGVVAQRVQELAKELGAFEYLVHEGPMGELTVDYTALLCVVSAGLQHRFEAAGI